jgi:predicted metal-binding protein
MLIKNLTPKTDLIFSIKVCEACKSCRRYGLTGCCPPVIGSFEYYKKLLKQYEHGKLFIEQFVIDDVANWKQLGKDSSLELHKVLLEERKKLLDKGHYFNVILGGGSCKWCEECSVPCKQPQFRAIPIEATGINVVATLAKMSLNIKFPVKNKFYRVGLLLWD